MRYWTTIGDPRDYHRDPLPHSLLSTRQTGERERESILTLAKEKRERESERERERETEKP